MSNSDEPVGKTVKIRAVDHCDHGVPIGTHFKIGDKEFCGQVHVNFERFADSSGRRTKAMENMAKAQALAAACYSMFSDRAFIVPEFFVSRCKLLNSYAKDIRLAQQINEWTSDGTCLWNFCHLLPGFCPFSDGITVIDGEKTTIRDFISKTHRLPSNLITPEGKSVPIWGLLSLVAVGKKLGDCDILGNDLKNAGWVWERDAFGVIIAASAVKIRFDETFSIGLLGCGTFENLYGMNLVYRTHFKTGNPGRWLSDLRDIQISRSNPELLIHWKELGSMKNSRFLTVLLHEFYDEGRKRFIRQTLSDYFKRNYYKHNAYLPQSNSDDCALLEEVSIKLLGELEKWMDFQQEIYEAPKVDSES